MYMRWNSFFTSIGFHAAIILIAIIGLPFLSHHDLVIPQPITVDLVEISKVSQTTQVTPKPQPPPPKPEPPKPAPAAVNSAPQPVAPVKEPPKPEEVKEPPKPNNAEEIDENALPQKSKKEIKKPEVKKVPQRDFSSVLKNLDVSKQPPPPPPPGQNTPIGEKMTMSEEDALRGQLEKCWNVPYGAKDADNMIVDVVMVINPDRSLREAHIAAADMARYNSDSFFTAMADSALRAVRSPLCSPFDLPPDKYNTWNTVTVTFNPKDMF